MLSILDSGNSGLREKSRQGAVLEERGMIRHVHLQPRSGRVGVTVHLSPAVCWEQRALQRRVVTIHQKPSPFSPL